jgi:hypothetical protein
MMEQCEARTGGACTRAATWKQSIYAGDRPSGRLLYYSYWCDEHAERIAARRRHERLAPADMMRLSPEAAERENEPHA